MAIKLIVRVHGNTLEINIGACQVTHTRFAFLTKWLDCGEFCLCTCGIFFFRHSSATTFIGLDAWISYFLSPFTVMIISWFGYKKKKFWPWTNAMNVLHSLMNKLINRLLSHIYVNRKLRHSNRLSHTFLNIHNRHIHTDYGRCCVRDTQPIRLVERNKFCLCNRPTHTAKLGTFAIILVWFLLYFFPPSDDLQIAFFFSINNGSPFTVLFNKEEEAEGKWENSSSKAQRIFFLLSSSSLFFFSYIFIYFFPQNTSFYYVSPARTTFHWSMPVHN